jgi:hypothetical protein
MRLLATHRSRLLPLLFAALSVVVGAPVEAQVDPTWDHYKLYVVDPIYSAVFPVLLQDQFGQYQHQTRNLTAFTTPVEKRVGPPPVRVYPITDPLTHYTWWEIDSQPFTATVRVDNQFGLQTLTVHEGLFLLNPALKNQTAGQLPVRNHYKCYFCTGDPVNVPVTLIDQFDTWQTIALSPKFLCNPALKQVGGQTYPIVDPRQHYVVYDLDPIDPGPFPAVIRDQFHQGSFNLRDGSFLMVPTDKLLVTETKSSTWGRLKSLYR